jgi:hypothetical protein
VAAIDLTVRRDSGLKSAPSATITTAFAHAVLAAPDEARATAKTTLIKELMVSSILSRLSGPTRRTLRL